MMKRLSLTILFCFALSGCIFEPVFETSSWDAFQRSANAIRAKLHNDDLRRLDIALKYLLAESAPRIAVAGPQFTGYGAGTNVVNPYVVLARLAPQINGKTAAEVIQDLAARLDAEIAAMEARNFGNVLGSVQVFSPTYYWKQSGYATQPVIEFSVRNDGNVPVSRVYFNAVLTSPGRSVPWARQAFVQDFKGGLEPHEKRLITIPVLSGDWRDPQLQYLPNAELKVTVANFNDANGERIVAFDSERLELERKILAELK
jgi:hypothetical protein